MKLEENKVYKMKWEEGAYLLPPKCANLIIADPPYFEVKGEFDFVWKCFDDYLKDVEKWAKACKHVLADNGTLFWWGDRKKIAYSQIILDRYFNLESSIRWENTNQHKQQIRFSKDLRSFPPMGEHLLMYSNEIGQTGLEKIKLDVNNFKPLRNYFEYVQKSLKLPKKAFLDKIGQAADHPFRWGSSQWDMPTEKTYDQLIEMFRIDLLEGFKTYEELRQEYEELRQEYEELRRPFDNFMNLGDVFKFANRETSKFSHETIKPEKISRILTLTSSKKGDLAIIPFCGSGTEHSMNIKEGRRSIAFDVEDKWVQMANNRAKQYLENRQISILDYVD